MPVKPDGFHLCQTGAVSVTRSEIVPEALGNLRTQESILRGVATWTSSGRQTHTRGGGRQDSVVGNAVPGG